MPKPRLIQIFFPSGTSDGIRVVEIPESPIKAYVVPRLKLNETKNIADLNHPALYLLISSDTNELYIGESENFFKRVKDHDQSKTFWDIAIAVVSTTNTLEKSDVKYLESLTVEKAQQSTAMTLLNKTVPARNTIHQFKEYLLDIIMEDTAFISELFGYSVFSTKEQQRENDTWYAKSKLSDARGQYRGDKFIILAGSKIDKTYAPSLQKGWPHRVVERNEIINNALDKGAFVELLENIPFRSASHAADIVSGTPTNAWVYWKDKDGKTMDQVIRKGGK